MSAEPPSMTTPENRDTPLNLNTAFSHPAGLEAARYTVRSYLRAAQGPLPPPSADDKTYYVPIPNFELSPEVASLLHTLLAFSDSEVQRSEGHDARLGEIIMDGRHGNENRISDCE